MDNRKTKSKKEEREEKAALTKLLLCVVGNGHRSMIPWQRPRFPHIRGPFPLGPSVRLHPQPLDGCIWVPTNGL